VANFSTGAAGVADTGGKYGTSVIDIGAKISAGVNNISSKKLEQYQTADTLK
jgi:hypothetical protein